MFEIGKEYSREDIHSVTGGCKQAFLPVKGGKVVATVVRHGKSAKVSIIKFRRRKHYLRQGTHRQQYTEVKVTDISAG